MKKPDSIPTTNPSPNRPSTVDIKLMFDILYQLKSVKRAGWLQSGLQPEQVESVADHSFFVGLMALLLADHEDESMDKFKVIQMALIHDLAESVIGDITPADDISLQEKFDRELAALESVLKPLPMAEELLTLWREFEQGNSAEAKFVRRLDKLEMVFQAARYEKTTGADLEGFFTSVSKLFDEGELTPALYELLLESRNFAP